MSRETIKVRRRTEFIPFHKTKWNEFRSTRKRKRVAEATRLSVVTFCPRNAGLSGPHPKGEGELRLVTAAAATAAATATITSTAAAATTVTATTSATATSAAIATTAAAATPAVFLGAGFVDGERTPVVVLVVQGRNRGLCLGIG